MAFPVQFKKYLASSLRNTRWGELIEAYQSIVGELDDDLIKKMLDQYDTDVATITDYINILEGFGWNYSSYDGWTASLEYFKRQALTCVARIKYKTTQRAYKNEFYIFNLIGNVYPLQRLVDDTLEPYIEWWSDPETGEIINILDSEDDNVLYNIPLRFDGGFELDSIYTFDSTIAYYDNPKTSGLGPAYLDTPSTIIRLDQSSILDDLTRFILIQYEFNKVEDASYFLSTNSVKALYNDIKLIKRLTEQVYFEPILKLYYNTDGSVKTTTYLNFEQDGESVGEMKTILMDDQFTDLNKIIVGDGSHSTIDGTITNVVSPVQTITSANIVPDTENPRTEFRKALNDKDQFVDFSEVACFDSSDNCFFYATFPMVKYYNKEQCYSNIKFHFEPSS